MKTHELEVRKQNQIEITNRLAALDNFNDSEDINTTWENIKENIKTSPKDSLDLYEFKQHILRFDEDCLWFLDQTKQAKIQWWQDPNQSDVGNLTNVRREVSRQFRNKKKEYLKAKIDKLKTVRWKNIWDLYRGINDFRNCCQPRICIVKGEKGDLVTNSHSILARWKNHLSAIECTWG